MIYIKKPTIVEAYQADVVIDFGSLGDLTTEDWIIKLDSGAMHTMADEPFQEKYNLTQQNSPLVGEDWD